MNLLFRIVSLNEGPISLKPQSSDPRCNSITDDDGAFDLAGQDESDTIWRLESILLSVTGVSKNNLCTREKTDLFDFNFEAGENV